MQDIIQNRERRKGRSSLTDRAILLPAIRESFAKLDPRWIARNPVMFVVEVGAVITTIIFVLDLFNRLVGLILHWIERFGGFPLTP